MGVGIQDRLKGIRRVAIDSAPFIYYIEESSKYIDLLNDIFDSIVNGKLTAYTSVVTLIEVLTKPVEINNALLLEKYNTLFSDTNNLVVVELQLADAINVAKLRAQYKIKTPDAIQIATAVSAGAELFITNDKGLSKVDAVDVLVLEDLL